MFYCMFYFTYDRSFRTTVDETAAAAAAVAAAAVAWRSMCEAWPR